MTSVMSPPVSASSESTRSTIARALNSGVAAAGSAPLAVPMAWRTASSSASQKSCASCWSRCTCITARRCGCPGRPAHARSSDVFPLPAGAEMTVTFRAAARSRAARRSPRSISRRAAGATDNGLPLFLRLTSCRRRHSPLATRPPHAVSTRTNHHDLATTFHLPGGQPGSVMKIRTAGTDVPGDPREMP